MNIITQCWLVHSTVLETIVQVSSIISKHASSIRKTANSLPDDKILLSSKLEAFADSLKFYRMSLLETW